MRKKGRMREIGRENKIANEEKERAEAREKLKNVSTKKRIELSNLIYYLARKLLSRWLLFFSSPEGERARRALAALLDDARKNIYKTPADPI